MALLLHEIEWGEPLLPAVADPAWEAEVKQRGAQVFEVDRRIVTSHWLREAAFDTTNYRPSELPERLFRIGNMVTSQENACRYCYGANRAYMKILGYPEAFIQQVERDVHMAEMDGPSSRSAAIWRDPGRARPGPRATRCWVWAIPWHKSMKWRSRYPSDVSTTASAP